MQLFVGNTFNFMANWLYDQSSGLRQSENVA